MALEWFQALFYEGVNWARDQISLSCVGTRTQPYYGADWEHSNFHEDEYFGCK